MIEQREKIFLPIAIFTALAFSLLRFSSIPVGTFFDDASYLILAESLANGEGYRLINFPSMPTEQAFPPGWPLLLTPFVRLFPGNLVVPKVVTLLFSLGSILLADRLFKSRLDSWQRPLFLLLIALNPLFVGSAGTAMSEPAFLFFSLLTLVLLDRYVEEDHRYWMAVIVLLCAFFSMVVRTAGITLVLAVIPFLIPRQRWRFVGVLGIGGVIIGGLLIFFLPRFVEDIFLFSPTYLGHVEYLLGELGSYLRFWNHLPGFDWPSIGNVLVPVFDLNLSFIPFFSAIKAFVPLILIALVVGGFVLNLVMVPAIKPTEFYFLLFVALFYLWTAYINEIQQRQLIPIIPFLSFYLIRFMFWVGRQLLTGFGHRNSQIIVSIFFGLIMLTMVGRNVQAWLNPVRDDVVRYDLGGEWLRENSEADAVYAVNYPRPSYLYSRRSTEYLPEDFEADSFEFYIDDRDIQYVLIQPELLDWHTGELKIQPDVEANLIPYLNHSPQKYKQVFSDIEDQVYIYEVLQ